MKRAADRVLMARLTMAAAGMLALASAGCYDVKAVQAFLMEPRRPVSGTEYRVLPPDVIAVASLHVAEINDKGQRVRPDGKINLPLVGEVTAAGRTAQEIEESLKQAAKEFYEQADAAVTIVGYNSQRFYVFGQVARPGPYAWSGHDTLLDALAQAQPTALAWPERIIVVRGSQPQEGGSAEEYSLKYATEGIHPKSTDRPRHEMTINLMGMVKSGDMSNNVVLLPNDVIYVQANPLAKVGLAIQNLLFPIRPAVETVTMPATAVRTAFP